MSVTINGTNGLTFNDSSTQTTAATGFGFKNRIINGAMVIDQRNAGASVTPAASAWVYSLDRWATFATQSSKLSVQQVSDAPTGFSSSLKITSLSAYSITSGDIFSFRQCIEGFNFQDFMYGTSSAATFTLSFWVKSSLTGTFGGGLQNSAGSRGYAFTYTISAANTWEYKTVTIAGDTTGTWVGATNGIGVSIIWGLGVGSNNSIAAGAWGNNTYTNSATGAVSVVGTNGATFYITGVQLEKGSTATSFDYRPYGTELALCKRYLPAFNLANGDALCMAAVNSANNFFGVIPFDVETRVPPTGVYANNGTYLTAYGSASHVSTSIAFGSASETCGRLNVGTSGATAGQAVFLQANNNLVLYFNGCEL